MTDGYELGEVRCTDGHFSLTPIIRPHLEFSPHPGQSENFTEQFLRIAYKFTEESQSADVVTLVYQEPIANPHTDILPDVGE